MAEKEKLMEDYRRMLHELAVARNPIEAETARNIAENVITMLSVKLSERERKVIMLRYFRDKTQGEVSKILGVSQVQISRLENKIFCPLRGHDGQDRLAMRGVHHFWAGGTGYCVGNLSDF